MIGQVRNNLSFALLILTVFLLPAAQIKTEVWGLPIYAPEWAVLGAFGAFLWQFWPLFSQKERMYFPDRLISLGALFFLLGAALSFTNNPFSLTGLGMVKSWFFFPALFGILLWYQLQENNQLKIVLVSWFISLCGVALWSLGFFFGGRLTYDGRLAGQYDSPNFLAYFIAPGILLALYLLFEVKERFSKRIFLVFVPIGIGLVTIGSVIFLTQSYSVWIASLVALLVFFLSFLLIFSVSPKKTSLTSLILKEKLLFLPLFLCIVGGSFFLFDQGSEKWQALVQRDDRSSLSSRLMIWQSARMIIGDHPIFGIGAGRFQEEYLAYQQFFPPYLEWAVPEPHNFFLALFLATGMLGVFGFFLSIGRLGYLFFRCQDCSQEKKLLTALFLALWALFFVYGAADTPYFKTDLAYSFFLLFALSLALVKKTLALEASKE